MRLDSIPDYNEWNCRKVRDTTIMCLTFYSYSPVLHFWIRYPTVQNFHLCTPSYFTNYRRTFLSLPIIHWRLNQDYLPLEQYPTAASHDMNSLYLYLQRSNYWVILSGKLETLRVGHAVEVRVQYCGNNLEIVLDILSQLCRWLLKELR
jgi:hypothetical protein